MEEHVCCLPLVGSNVCSREELSGAQGLVVVGLGEVCIYIVLSGLVGYLFILTLTGEDDHRLGLPSSDLNTQNPLNQIRTEAKPGSVLITTAQGKCFSNGLDLAYAAQPNGSINIPRLREMVDGFKSIVSDFLTLPLSSSNYSRGIWSSCSCWIHVSFDRGVLYMSFPYYFMALMKSKITSPTARRNVLGASKFTADKAVELGIIDSMRNWKRL
ncbi:hypothetical protein MKW94_024864 [Papaver nudicaule]|uniref:Uncharacterized protein n=1 Tax=Papaver nudicaule TaxID=74823 RepID=A0AA41VJ57_PAPNU|nr:hypothetical protein [Papaver nudicaule]